MLAGHDTQEDPIIKQSGGGSGHGPSYSADLNLEHSPSGRNPGPCGSDSPDRQGGSDSSNRQRGVDSPNRQGGIDSSNRQGGVDSPNRCEGDRGGTRR